MSGATARLPRLLALVPYLLARPGVAAAQVTEHFGITERQLLADVQLLYVCGLPGHGPGDLIDIAWDSDDTVTLRESAGIARPLRLTADEALALVVALRTLADVPGLPEGDALERALAKLEGATGSAVVPTGRVEVAVEAEERVLVPVRDALARGRRLHLGYHVAARDETTERDVDPMRLLLVEGRSYLEGWCRRVEAVRLFRLDRVVSITVLDVAAAPPPAALPRDLSEGLFQPSETDEVVTLLLGPTARWVADYYPCEPVAESAGGEQAETADGQLRVRLRTPQTGWVRRLALRLGSEGRVEEPAELAALVRSDAREALAAYDV